MRVALHVSWPNWPIQLGGLVLLLLPLVRTTQWTDRGFRLRLLCSILIFSTIFNHQVESPSFVIAMSGVAILFVLAPPRLSHALLLALVLLVVSLGTNDIMPHAIRTVVAQYKLKTLPCLAVWLMLQDDLLGLRRV